MQEHERTEVEALVDAVSGLMDQAQQLARDEGIEFKTLTRRAHENRVLATVAVVGLVLDILITLVLGFVGLGMKSNTERIDALTKRLDIAQTTTRQKALCPLYQVFLDSKSDAARKASPDPKKYDHAFEVIQEGYDALACDEFISKT